MDETVTTKQPTAPTDKLHELVLSIEINGVKIEEDLLLLQGVDEKLYARAVDIKQLRLLPPTTQPIVRDGVDYFDLGAYPGLTYKLNQAKQSVSMNADGKIFIPTTTAAGSMQPLAPKASNLGGFFNYDLVTSNAVGVTQGAGQFELGVFNRYGVCTGSTFTSQIGTGTNLSMTRLDTTCTQDQPSDRQSWRLGDLFSRAGDWGIPTRVGGIQFANNFGTQPGFISIPVKQAGGITALPSTVDVYVNNSLMSRSSVPAGPFSITNVPVVTGSGEVRMVVRDVLGREQVVTQPFYASQDLLAPGLNDYSYEVGFVRENFGINSYDYGKPVAAGTQRRGFSDVFTGEVHVETQGSINTAGVAGVYLVPTIGAINGSIATSQGNNANGSRMAVGLERQAYPFSIGVRTQLTSSEFHQLGLAEGQVPSAHQTSGNVSYSIPNLGSLSLSYLTQTQVDQTKLNILTANYSVQMQRYGALNMSAIRTTGDGGSTQLFIIWSIPIGGSSGHGASVMHNSTHSQAQGSMQQTTATAQKGLPYGEGYGYQLQARDSGDKRASLSYQNNVGTYSLDADQMGNETATRAGVRGGVAFLGGETFLSRSINSSFGVARVPGFPNVNIYADNQVVGKTDAAGNALIPRLRPYENNKVSVDAEDLPMNAEIDSVKMTAVPYFRSGVLIDFPIRRSNGAVFRVTLENGNPLPTGSTVENQEAKIVFPVATNGEVYFTGLLEHNHITAKWRGQSCEFDVVFKQSEDALPDLGSFICKGVRP